MNATDCPSRPRALLLGACACAALALPATAAEPAPSEPVRTGIGCIDTSALLPMAGVEDAAGGAAQTRTPPARSKQSIERRRERLRPMTRRELRSTIRALEPIQMRSGEWTIRAATSRDEVDYDRMKVVYTDAIGLLTFLQAEDALIRLSELPGSDPQLIEQMEGSFDLLGDCLQGRFEPWGGEETMAEMLGMVDDLRPRLESLIIKQLERRGAPEDPR